MFCFLPFYSYFIPLKKKSYNCLTFIALFGLHYIFSFLSFIFLVFYVCLSCKFLVAVCIPVWSSGKLGSCPPACVCVGQMPFPPEYLASPPERLKKEKKPKTPKNKKETTGKVREEKERLDAWICKKNQSLQPFQEINF